MKSNKTFMAGMGIYLFIFLIVLYFALTGCGNSEFRSGPECKVSKGEGVTILVCNEKEFKIYDGLNGEDGKDGEDGEDFTGPDGVVIGYIDPCGNNGPHDEIILVTSDGELISYFAEDEDALNSRFVMLENNKTYMTTDGYNCRFKVQDGDIVDEKIINTQGL